MKTNRILNLLSAVTLTVGLIPANSHAASGTWSDTPTNGFWEAASGETNWTTGEATFPGALDALTNNNVATFLTSNTTTIAINSSGAGNSSPLGIRGIAFGVGGSTPSAFTIGSAGANMGNSLLLGHTGTITFASGSTGTVTQIVNAPLVLQPASGTTAGTYQFVNSSANTNALEINGNISGGTTTLGIALTLSGANSNAGNVLSGVISNGAAGGNFPLTKVNSGTWAITGINNSFTGGVRVDQGTLNVATMSKIGTNSSIGAGGAITFIAGGSGNAFLTINGAGGTTDRAITFNNNTGGTNHAVLSSGGSGPVVLTGSITPGAVGNTTSAIFELAGTNIGANIASGAIADNSARITSLIKSGAGTWTLSGNNSYTGTTAVNGGILTFQNTSTRSGGSAVTAAAAGSIGLGVGAASGD